MKIPPHYLPVMPYLILSDTKAFLDFTIAVFDAHEQLIDRDENNQIRHGEIGLATR